MAKVYDLEKAIGNILADYGDKIADNIKDATKEITKAGVKAVKTNARSQFGGTGKYASGWTSQVETNQMSAQGIIYNKSMPGLPHLLENGHAKRGGGRVPGRVHIEPVERQLVREFEEKITRAI